MHAKHQTRMALLFAAVLSLLLLSMYAQIDGAPPPALNDAAVSRVYLPLIFHQPPSNGPIPPDDPVVEQVIAAEINRRRQNAGLPPLALHPALTQAARRHCHDMAGQDVPSHTGSDGSSVWDRVRDEGYEATYVGEIIAWGQSDTGDVIQWWMNSPPHRAMVLSTRMAEFGVAYVRDSESRWGYYWTVVFGQEGS